MPYIGYLPDVGHTSTAPISSRPANLSGPGLGGPLGPGLLGVIEDIARTARYGAGVSAAPGLGGSILRSGYYNKALPPWVDPTKLGGVRTITNPATGEAMSVNVPGIHPFFGDPKLQGDERVFMGKYVQVTGANRQAAIRGGSDIPGSVLKGLTGTDIKQPKKRTRAPDSITVSAAMELPYTWDEDEVDGAIKKMRAAGIEVTNFDDMYKVWGNLVDRASKTFGLSDGKRLVTPWDVLDMYKKESSKYAEGASAAEEPFSGKITQTHKTVSEISEGDAWQVLRSNLQTLLGRDPTDQEIRDFTYRMNHLAAKNPTLTKTTSTYKDGRMVDQTDETTDAGFTPGDVTKAAYDRAQDDPEYGAYQSASTYYNAAVQAIMPVVGL